MRARRKDLPGPLHLVRIIASKYSTVRYTRTTIHYPLPTTVSTNLCKPGVLRTLLYCNADPPKGCSYPHYTEPRRVGFWVRPSFRRQLSVILEILQQVNVNLPIFGMLRCTGPLGASEPFLIAIETKFPVKVEVLIGFLFGDSSVLHHHRRGMSSKRDPIRFRFRKSATLNVSSSLARYLLSLLGVHTAGPREKKHVYSPHRHSLSVEFK
jgi:hypothetical protein